MSPGSFAGVLDRRGRPDAGELERLTLALADDGAAETWASGPFAIAWTGGDSVQHGRAFILVDGCLDTPSAATRSAADLIEEGDSALAALRGDFAIVAWDGRRGLLARDHLGTRGLLWHDDGSQLRFASEMAPLLSLLPATPEPDLTGVAHWLGISVAPGEQTLLQGIRRIPAAHALSFGAGDRPRVRRYWAVRPEPLMPGDDADHARALRQTLVAAVARRSRDGDSTGLLLSGGLDSATVGGLAAGALPPEQRPRRAYSAVFPDHPSVDEAALIDRLVRAYEMQSVRAVVRRGSVLHGALPYIERWRLPPTSPNLFFWHPLLARAASDGIRVMLDGEGGDELFGLSPYLVSDLLASGRVRAALRLIRDVPGAEGDPTPAQVRRYLRRYGLRGLAPAWTYRAYRRLRDPLRYAEPWFLPATVDAYLSRDDQDAWKQLPGPRWWRYLAYTFTRSMAAGHTLDHVRRRAAMAGLVPRHPIMDVDVLELVLRLPPDLAFDARLTRPLIRRAVEGHVPDEVRVRPTKSNFDAVFHAGLAGPDLPVARSLLGAADARVRAYVDLPGMKVALLDGEPPPAGFRRMRWATTLWRLLTAECWLRSLEDPSAPRAAAEAAGMPDPQLEIVTSRD